MPEISNTTTKQELIAAGTIDETDIIERNAARPRDQIVYSNETGLINGGDGDDIYQGQDGLAERFFFDGRHDNNDEGRHVNVVRGFSFTDGDQLKFRLDGGFFRTSDGEKIAQSSNGNQASFETARDLADLLLTLNLRDGVEEGIGKTIDQADIDANTGTNGRVDSTYRRELRNETTDGSFVRVINGHIVMNFDDGRSNGETIEKWGNYRTNDVMVVFEDFAATLAAQFAYELGFTLKAESAAKNVRIAQGGVVSGGADDTLFILSNQADTAQIDHRDASVDDGERVSIIHGFDLATDSIELLFNGGPIAGVCTAHQGIRDLLGLAETFEDSAGDLVLVLNPDDEVPLTIVLTDIKVEDITSVAGPLNSAPIAMDDSFVTNEDTALTIPPFDLLTNDTDADGDTLALIAVQGAVNGSVEIDQNGNVVFVPDANFNGQGSFGYTISDGKGGTSSATATVDVISVNDAPTLAFGQASVSEDGPTVQLDLATLGDDTDADDDPTTLAYGIVGQPVAGAASIEGTVLSFDPAGAFDQLPAFTGSPVIIGISATDSNGATANSFVEVQVGGANDAPTLAAGAFSVDEDDALRSLDLATLANDVDADDDAGTLSYEITGFPALGTASIENGALIFRPGADFQWLAVDETQDVEIELTATDRHGAQAINLVTVTVTGRNDGPSLDLAPVLVRENDGFVTVDLSLSADDIDSDDDGSTLNYFIGIPPTLGTADIDGSLLTFDLGTDFADLMDGEIRSETILIEAFDRHGQGVQRFLQIDVESENAAPTFTDFTASFGENDPVSGVDLSPFGDDPDPEDDGLTLGYEITGAPSAGSASISAADPTVLLFDTAGAFDSLNEGEIEEVPVEITVTDSKGATGSGIVTVEVQGINNAPTLAAASMSAFEDGPQVMLDMAAFGDDVDNEDNGTSLIYTVTGQPQEGSASLNGTVLSFDPGNDFEDLSIGETRDVTVEITAQDARGATTVGTVTVTVEGMNEGPTIRISDVGGTTGGFSITGDDGVAGFSVSSAGDVNGDGLEDVILGAPRSDVAGELSGAAYVVFGKTDDTPVDLAQIEAGIGGFVVRGATAGDLTGSSVSGAGDVNGDGLDDLIIGAPRFDDRTPDTTNIYVENPEVVLSAFDYYPVRAPVPDLNDDGIIDDLEAAIFASVILGTFSQFPDTNEQGGYDPDSFLDFVDWDPGRLDSGAAFVVFGKADGDAVEIQDIEDGEGGFAMIGDRFRAISGAAVSAAGDVNGDGLDDLFVGAPGNSATQFARYRSTGAWADEIIDVAAAYEQSFRPLDPSPGTGSPYGVNDADADREDGGSGFVVFGKSDGATVDLDDIELSDTSAGFAINGFAFNSLGYSVDAAGDLNGDGFGDLLIGPDQKAVEAEGYPGALVVFGGPSGAPVNITNINDLPYLGTGDPFVGDIFGSGGYFIDLESSVARVDRVAGAGDVNGDGYDDVILGSAEQNRAVVVFTQTVPGPLFSPPRVTGNDVNVPSALANDQAFQIIGLTGEPDDRIEVDGAGDINGDGLDDLLVVRRGDFNINGSGDGGALSGYLIYGKADAVDVDVRALEDADGLEIFGGGLEWTSLSAAGDVNGDGFDDLLAGFGPSNQSYVIFGSDNGTADFVGGDGDDFQAGGAGAESFIGGAGNDTLIGGGGADNLQGGGGNDVLAVGDVQFARIDGGTGMDTLRFDGNSIFWSLQSMPEDLVRDIEVIDLNAGGNTVFLGLSDILRLSSETNTLRIDGDGDIVNLSGGSAATGLWARTGTLELPNGDVFDVLENGGARLELNQDLTIPGRDAVIIDAPELFTAFGGTDGGETLVGTPANELFFAGDGDDIIFGGGGQDTAFGDGGADTFVLTPVTGQLTIGDFSHEDLIDLSAFVIIDFPTLSSQISAIGSNGESSLIDLAPGTSLLLEGIAQQDLAADDFIF